MLAIRLQIFLLAMIAASAACADVIVTRDNVFYIPFSASNDVTNGNLSLFVSGNRGASWQFYQRQPARVGRFSFRAGVDGEFWFAVRASTDADGANTAQFDQPELRVSIDRQQPRLTLLGKRAPNGTVICQWTADDPHLDLTSLQVECRPAGVTSWAPVSIDSQSIQTQGTITTGWAEMPSHGASVIQLRASIKDRAGNIATVERDYDLVSLPRGDRSDRELAERGSPGLDAMGGDLNRTDSPRGAPAPDSDRVATSRGGAQLTTGPKFDPLPDASSPPIPAPPIPSPSTPSPPIPSPPINTAAQPFAVRDAGPGPNLALEQEAPAGEVYGWRGGDADDLPQTAAPPSPVDTEALSDLPSPGGIQAETNPMIANYPSTGMPDMLADTSHRVSNSRRFELDYDVDSVSAAQIHRVEVWFTQDGGRTWQHHGDDEDLVSPYLMHVKQDGVVGVRLLVQTQSGFTIRPPESGDPADVWIRVDATRPVGRITSVKYGTGANAGALELYWEARDENLSDRPILFLYSDRPEGPWRKVAGALPNTGQYVWRLDDRVPAQIYLRMEVNDTAGNVIEETLLTPINNQRISPRGHIRDVRPAAVPGGRFSR